ncbi:MAG: tetratricopeptide repeat protein [Bacteroidota bacterium]
MLKRALLMCVSMLLMGQMGLFAQVDLTNVKDLIAQESYAEAEKELRGYLTTKQKNTDEIYYYLGMISYYSEDYAGATQNFQAGLDAKGKSPLNKVGMGLMMMKENKVADALVFLEEAVSTNKGKNVDVDFAASLAYMEGGPDERGTAKQILYDLREKAELGDDSRPNIYLGEYYVRQGVQELALEELEKGITKAPDYVPAYVYLAELYFAKGKESKEAADFQAGFEKAQAAVSKDPDYAPAYRIRGELYLLLGKYDKARDDLQKYVSLTGDDLKARIRYASFLFLSENYDEALTEIAKIEGAGAGTNVTRRLKGMSLFQLGKLGEAQAAMEDYFNQVKKEEYLIEDDYEITGHIYREQGNFDKADEYYAKLIQKNADRDDIFATLADKYNKQAKSKIAEARKISKERGEVRKSLVTDNGSYKALTAKIKETEDQNEKATLTEQANALVEGMTAKQAQMEELAAQSKAKRGEAKPFYTPEAHYRQKVVDFAEAPSLQNFYKLGLAQYNADMYEEADGNFKEVHKLKDDYLNPYIYRIQIAQKKEAMDTTSNSWYIKEPCGDIINVWGDKDPSSLDKNVTKNLLLSYEVFSFYSFNPSGDEGDYHCDDANQYMSKIYSIDPNYDRVKAIADYCESVGQGVNR